MIKTMHVCVKGVKRSLNSFNCYSCRKGQKITLCTQYRYIQCYVERVERLCYLHNMDMSIQMIITMYVCVKGVKRNLNSFNGYSCQKGQKITLCTQYRCIQCYVERVKRLCYVETRDKHIFAHNFLNIQLIFNPQKVLENWDLDLSNHTIKGSKVKITFKITLHYKHEMIGTIKLSGTSN